MTTTVKKAFQPVVDLLQANTELAVSDVLPDVIELCKAKRGTGGGRKGQNFHLDPDSGKVVAVYCNYFKAWADPAIVPFSEKKGSTSGYQGMSKEGMSNFNKQKAAQKKAESELLDKVMAGEVGASDLPELREAIANEASKILETEQPFYDTLDELLEAQAEEAAA